MNVTLISHTPDAMDLLIFTKHTRLNMSPGLLAEIRAWPIEKKLKELEYMSQTIPSSWEFVDYVFLVEGVSRAYTHQQVRTRAASYAQQSMRVVGMGEYDYIYTDRNREDHRVMTVINNVNGLIRVAYNQLISMGQATEDARGILPTNIATNIVCKFNLRTFSELARSRSGGRTQSEYQKVIRMMVDRVLDVHPWAEMFIFKQDRNYFDDIEAFAERKFGGDLSAKGELLKIVDHMRKGE
jgi:flavin-dependent thymidylate synthase